MCMQAVAGLGMLSLCVCYDLCGSDTLHAQCAHNFLFYDEIDSPDSRFFCWEYYFLDYFFLDYFAQDSFVLDYYVVPKLSDFLQKRTPTHDAE